MTRLAERPGSLGELAPESQGKDRVRMVVRAMNAQGKAVTRSFPPHTDVTVGRDGSCHVVLPSRFVSRQHVAVRLQDDGFVVTDSSTMGTKVGKETLRNSARVLKGTEAKFWVGPYEVSVRRRASKRQSGAHRRRIHGELLNRMQLQHRKLGEQVSPELRAEVRRALSEIVDETDFGVEKPERQRVVSELCDEALGLGPLEALLADSSVSEVMVVDAKTIYAERNGQLELTGRSFSDNEAVRSAIERIVTPLGRRIDESSPLVDARLADGSRVNAVIPPLALRGPCITIRKFPHQRLTMDNLVAFGSLNARMARFLERSVRLKKNIVVSGGTGSGKTTLLNVLSAGIGESERVVTIEDAAELNLAQPHVVGLESKPPNLEGRGQVNIRDLLKNALRMRPDRIVVGECRGGEALDMLQAMNTGHEGSMTTTHANSPRQAVLRLETLCLMSGLDLPLAAIRRQIADSVHLVVQQARLTDGRRCITAISEVTGMSEENEVELRDLFCFDRGQQDEQGRAGVHAASGFMPSYLPELERHYASYGEAVF